MAFGCGKPVTWYQVHGFREVAMNTTCGTYQTDVQGRQEQRICNDCESKARKQFPQGWETYPGDRCVHGVYVGRVGFDYMCHICEGGG